MSLRGHNAQTWGAHKIKRWRKNLMETTNLINEKKNRLIEIWMSFVGVSMSIGGIPQLYRMWTRKTSEDISIVMWVVMIHGIAWWLYYGIRIKSASLIVTNSVCLIIDIAVLAAVLFYRQ